MTLEEVRSLVHAAPFQSFDMFLADGSFIRVPHPDFIAIGKNVVVVIGEDDVSKTIDPLHIVSLEEAVGCSGEGARLVHPASVLAFASV